MDLEIFDNSVKEVSNQPLSIQSANYTNDSRDTYSKLQTKEDTDKGSVGLARAGKIPKITSSLKTLEIHVLEGNAP